MIYEYEVLTNMLAKIRNTFNDEDFIDDEGYDRMDACIGSPSEVLAVMEIKMNRLINQVEHWQKAFENENAIAGKLQNKITKLGADWSKVVDERNALNNEIERLKTKTVEIETRYFEVLDPYYALLKAENKEKALVVYNANVAELDDVVGLDDDEGIYEVPESYALVKLSQAPGEDGKLIDPKTILEDFENENIHVLLIDGALL